MKTGTTLVELAHELERQKNAKRDFVVPTEHLQIQSNGESKVRIGSDNDPQQFGVYRVSEHMHSQVSQRLGIPKKFYDRMRKDHADVFDTTVNALLEREPEKRLVRTLGSTARAFLSDRYRRLDNADLAEAILPTLATMGVDVHSVALTERKLYLKCVIENVQAEVNVGDVVQAGLVISNSEIGIGAVQVQPLIYRLICKNGMIATDQSWRKHNVGRLATTEETSELFTTETMQADDKAFFMKVRDVVRAVADQTLFEKIVDRMREATEDPITGKVERVVEALANRAALNDSEQSSVLRHLIEGGDLSRYGMMNAITATARDDDDALSYDRATELEAIGGQVIELPRSDWQVIATAA